MRTKAILASAAILITSLLLAVVRYDNACDNPAGLRDAVADDGALKQLLGAGSPDQGVDVPAVAPQPAQAVKTSPLAVTQPGAMAAKEWTMMIFANGRNNLTISEMLGLAQTRVGSNENLNIVMEAGLDYVPEKKTRGERVTPTNIPAVKAGKLWIPKNAIDKLPQDFPTAIVMKQGVFRYYVEKQDDRIQIAPPKTQLLVPSTDIDKTGPLNPFEIANIETGNDGFKGYTVFAPGVLEDRSNADMGDWRELADFVEWTKLRFPARRYLLIIANHGAGFRGISFDDISKHHMTARTVAQALKRSNTKVDILAFHACLMQMAEVAYELKDSAHYIAASEEVSYGPDMSYGDIASLLANSPRLPTQDIAASFVTFTAKNVTSEIGQRLHGDLAEYGVAYAVLETGALDGFSPLLDSWTSAVISANEREAVKYAAEHVLRFYNDNKMSPFGDLGHFVSLTDKKAKSPEVKKAGKELLAYMADKLIGPRSIAGYKSYREDDYSNARGLSIGIINKAITAKPGDYPRIAGDVFNPPDAAQLDKMLNTTYMEREAERKAMLQKFPSMQNSTAGKEGAKLSDLDLMSYYHNFAISRQTRWYGFLEWMKKFI